MLKKIILAAVLSTFLATPALAADPTDQELAHQLGTQLGLESMIESIKQQTGESIRKQTAKMMENYRAGMPNLPEEVFREMETIFDEFTRDIMSSWSSEQAIAIYTDSLVSDLPREQIRRSLEHYSSEEGQAELKAVNTAAMKLNAYINDAVLQASDKASQNLMQRIQEVVMNARRQQMEDQQKEKAPQQ